MEHPSGQQTRMDRVFDSGHSLPAAGRVDMIWLAAWWDSTAGESLIILRALVEHLVMTGEATA
jgi:hypothetical protein